MYPSLPRLNSGFTVTVVDALVALCFHAEHGSGRIDYRRVTIRRRGTW